MDFFSRDGISRTVMIRTIYQGIGKACIGRSLRNPSFSDHDGGSLQALLGPFSHFLLCVIMYHCKRLLVNGDIHMSWNSFLVTTSFM